MFFSVSIAYGQYIAEDSSPASSGDVQHNGDIGFNTSSPSARIHIEQPSYSGGNSQHSSDYFKIEQYQLSTPPFPPSPATKAPIFMIKNGGNVGIGTNSPSEKLHVNGNGLFKGNLTIGNNNWTKLEFDGTGDNNWMLNAHSDGQSFHLRALNSGSYSYHMTIKRSTGNVGIGTTSPEEKLHVDGNTIIEGDLTIKGSNSATDGDTEIKLHANGDIRAREIKVDLATIPDYVFAEDYELMPLEEVADFIEENHHLPNVKSEAEYQEEGAISLTEMNLKLLEKVEELTLYTLQQQEAINALQAEIENLKK